MRFQLAILIYILSAPLLAKTTKFEVRDALARDSITFTSEAPLERTFGINPAVWGWIELDPDNLAAGIKGELECDVRGFETGSRARNDYLRERFFASAENPLAGLSIVKVLSRSKERLKDQVPVSVRIETQMKWRGVTKSVPLLVRLTYFKESAGTKQRLFGNLLHISGATDIDLNLFGITLPDSLKYKIARFVQVTADLLASDGSTPPLAPDPVAGANAPPVKAK